MLIEAVSGLVRYRWPGGEVSLAPGHPMDLPEARALKLLAKAPGKVRMVNIVPDPAETSLIGHVVSWDSPLFGLLSATVCAESSGTVTVRHPVTEQEAVIPKGMLVSILPRRSRADDERTHTKTQ